MAMPSFGGIDVSKGRLDVMVLPEEHCSSVSNDAGGWAELVDQLRGSSNRRRGRAGAHPHCFRYPHRRTCNTVQHPVCRQSRYRCSQTRCLPQENRASEHVARC